jgi:NAD(P)-dependent dehydrogenase (short-subunit alcohol dehydrogenase family)
MTLRLQGKVALVTGAGSGIGRAAALAFAEEGAKVVAADVVPEGLEDTVKTINEAGGEAISVKADVSQPQQVEAVIKAAVDTYGRLDCAFNNAGVEVETGVPTHLHSEEGWKKTIAVNLEGVWLCMKYEIEQMLKQGSGAIVNTSSIAGLTGRGGIAYAASKHGVVGMTKAAALENATKGIRVNAVCPAAIDTAMVRQAMSVSPELKEYIENLQPMGRVGRPEEVAQAVVWLCSDAASFTTGHALPVDGGLMAQ